MDNTIAARLEAFRLTTGLNKSDFAAAAGIGQRTYAYIEAGRTKKVSSDYLSSIEAAFKDVNSAWLRNGVGSMLRSSQRLTVAPTPAAPPDLDPIDRVTLPESLPHQVLTPRMVAEPNLDHLSPEEQAAYWKRRFEQAQTKLDARDHEDAVQHARPGRKPAASSGAASLRHLADVIASEVPAPARPAAGVQRQLWSA